METTMTATRIDRGSTETTTIYSEGGDLIFERTFDAPRERVWKAFMDPEIVPRWWGPHGTTTIVAEMDVRPGGKWRYVSRAPDREDVAFYGEYLEIDAPERFAWTFMFDVEGMGPRAGRRRTPSRTWAAEPGSAQSATSARLRPSRAPWRAAWSPVPSRPGIGSRPCSARSDSRNPHEPGTTTMVSGSRLSGSRDDMELGCAKRGGGRGAVGPAGGTDRPCRRSALRHDVDARHPPRRIRPADAWPDRRGALIS